ncbi:MocR-like pyridoxine biosynthesis transcription factor PdxR [Delftia acidovorans]|uniref:MocR-like pyridoxine biosynthesis transcription factor PdxR n=1 Tax=Delftia acidovorans TaxID=80866 RepID=UPI0028A689FC|nr:PLP-dependent aminotransferase family protein [Delftia acidovorans]
MHASDLLTSPLLTGAGAPPRQRQLIQRLKQAILAGRLPAGDRLPASRALSEDLGVSRNTVLIAYEQLAAEGYVVADRQGTRVAAVSTHSTAAAEAAAAPPCAPRTARRLDRIAPTRHAIDRSLPLTPGTPALDRFPLPAWRRSQDRALRLPASATLDYGDPAGEPALRQAIAQHLRISRGVRCDASRIIVTEGAQGALDLCVQLLTNPGDHAWLEEPGYRGAKSAFAGGDLCVSTLRVDADGAAIAPGLWDSHPPRLIQITPSHQYPTGAVLSVARRLDLLERARRAGAWIIEDDYDSEFRHQGTPIAAMQGQVPDAPVLYVGTFSKTMFPALRLGFVVLPQALATSAASAVQEMLRGGHRLEQLAMADFMESGQFSRHLGRMRRLYRERQAALREALATQLGVEHEVLGGHGGLHLTVRLPPDLSDRAIVEQARRAGMNPGALSSFALAPLPQDNGLVIGYGNTDAARFGALVRRLGKLAAAALPR